MNYKRLEIYVGWTCNQKCTYCMEYQNMEQTWSKKVTKYDILKKLLKYKKLGYNHVTYLGGEPFIQGVFLDALKLGKKLGYTILVTTNATTLHIDSQASKFLPYIDELIISVEGISKEKQQIISRTVNYVHWEDVFKNIKKYWNGNMLKANLVITKDNLFNIYKLVIFVYNNGIKNISVTYPDINRGYYTDKHILDRIIFKYSDCMSQIFKIINYCKINKINLKLPDFPFCIFPKNNIKDYILYTDDYDYATRIKIDNQEQEIDRLDLSHFELTPRERKHISKCDNCIYKNSCWGPASDYVDFFGDDEINPIMK